MKGHSHFSAHPEDILPVVYEAVEVATSVKIGPGLAVEVYRANNKGLLRTIHEMLNGRQVDSGVIQVLSTNREAALNVMMNVPNVKIIPSTHRSWQEPFTRAAVAQKPNNSKGKK